MRERNDKCNATRPGSCAKKHHSPLVGARGNHKSVLTRRRQEKISKILEEGINGMLNENVEKFYRSAKEIFDELELLYPDDQELRREVYKYLCMLCDILQENRKDIPRNELVSFHEMEKCTEREQIRNYSQRIISDIGKYLEAEKTGSRHGTILELLAYIEQHYNEDIGLN